MPNITMKWLLPVIILVLVSGCTQESKQKCGMENCHGLDITCGSNVPELCTLVYQFGDNCRQYASCEIIDGQCQLVTSNKFYECKSCVEKCIEGFEDNDTGLFRCENGCRMATTTTTVVTTTTIEESQQCSEPIMFDYPPVVLDGVEYIRPLGCVGGSHVTPIDHQYLISKNYGTDQEAVSDVLSPADGTITSIQHMGSIPTGYEYIAVDDYRVVIEHTCSISSVFIHIDNLSEKIMAVAPSPGEYKSVSVAVSAGEVIGSYSGSLDYNVVDTDVELTGFVIPDSYNEEWKTHIPDPFEYFNEPVRSQLIAKGLRTAEPIGGKIDYDIDGRLVGTWFKENTNKYAGLDPYNYWAGHLSIIYDCYDPEHIVVSFGNYSGSPRDTGVKGNAPDPADVGVGELVKYELVDYDYYDGNNHWDSSYLVKGLDARNNDAELHGTVLFQLTENRKLKMEIFDEKTASEVTGFTDNAIVYER